MKYDMTIGTPGLLLSGGIGMSAARLRQLGDHSAWERANAAGHPDFRRSAVRLVTPADVKQRYVPPLRRARSLS